MFVSIQLPSSNMLKTCREKHVFFRLQLALCVYYLRFLTFNSLITEIRKKNYSKSDYRIWMRFEIEFYGDVSIYDDVRYYKSRCP